MTDGAFGRIWLTDGRHGLTLRRELAPPPETVWARITDPDALARWFSPVSGDLRPGGRYLIDFGDETGGGEIRHCEAPHRLEATWDLAGEAPSLLTVTLAATPGGGTALTLDHGGLPAGQTAGHAAGWHAYLDRLAGDLSGDEPLDWWTRWQAVVGPYREQFAALPSDAAVAE